MRILIYMNTTANTTITRLHAAALAAGFTHEGTATHDRYEHTVATYRCPGYLLEVCLHPTSGHYITAGLYIETPNALNLTQTFGKAGSLLAHLSEMTA